MGDAIEGDFRDLNRGDQVLGIFEGCMFEYQLNFFFRFYERAIFAIPRNCAMSKDKL